MTDSKKPMTTRELEAACRAAINEDLAQIGMKLPLNPTRGQRTAFLREVATRTKKGSLGVALIAT